MRATRSSWSSSGAAYPSGPGGPVSAPRIIGAGLALDRSMPESRPYLAGVGVAQVVEDVQGQAPGVVGPLRISYSVVGVAEVGEDRGFIEPIGEFAEDAKGTAVTVDGLEEAAEVMLGVADAVPGVCLAATVADLTVQCERPPTEHLGLSVVTQPGVPPAGVIEGAGLTVQITSGLIQGDGLLGVAERVSMAVLALADPAKGQVGAGLPGAITELPVEPEALRQLCTSLVVVGELGAAMCEQATSLGLTSGVAEADRGGQGGALDGGPVVPVPSPVKEVRHGPGKLPGAGVEP